MSNIFSILIPSKDLDATVDFFKNSMGLITHPQNQLNDPQFKRHVTFQTANGVTLVVVEPTSEFTTVYTHPVISIAVNELTSCHEQFHTLGLEFLTAVAQPHTEPATMRFRSPNGTPYQMTADASPHQPTPIQQGAEGVEWILVPTTHFEETIGFFENTLKFSVLQRGTPVHDLRFHQYAQYQVRNGVVLEVVEPIPTEQQSFRGPVISITVKDLLASRKQLEKAGLSRLSDIVDGEDGSGWFYFEVPGSTTFQLQGPLG